MDLVEFKKLLDELNIPVTYMANKEKTALPFAVYYLNEDEDMYADDRHYSRVNAGNIELYVKNKDIDLENQLETLLADNLISYNKENESYIDDDDMIVIYYSFSFIERMI